MLQDPPRHSPRGVLSLKAALFIDGGHLRVLARQAGRAYDPDYIGKIARASIARDESLLRNLYYDCAPYRGSPPLPVSGRPANFRGSDTWLKELAAKPQFAVQKIIETGRLPPQPCEEADSVVTSSIIMLSSHDSRYETTYSRATM